MSTRAMRITVIGISWFLAAAFVFSGGMKLAGAEMQVENFERFGYPLWFLYAVGVWELLAAVLIFLPPSRFVGAVMIVLVMIGALGTHLWHEEWVQTINPLIPLILAAFVAWRTSPPGKRRGGGGGNGGPSMRRPIA